jgi:polar amino acid transport system substrate-binding protein
MKVTNPQARWLFVLCLCGALGLLVAACGGSSSSSSSTAASTEESSSEPASSEPASDEEKGSCTPKHKFKTVSAGELTVVMEDYMPYAMIENGELGGVDGELLQAFAEKECLKVNAVSVDAAAVIPQVQTGRADVGGADWWRTKERRGIVEMSEPTYLDSMSLVSEAGYNEIPELEGKQIGDLQGDIWNKEFKELFGSDYHLYSSFSQAMEDLENGRLEVVTASLGAIGYFQSQGEYTKFKNEEVKPFPKVSVTVKAPQSGIPYQIDNPELGEALNEVIAEMKENGEFDAIVEKYGLPTSVLETGPGYFI